MEKLKKYLLVSLFGSFLIVFLIATFSNRGIKEVVFKVAAKVKNLVYYEATIHNPQGDFLPDWIDDLILGKIKDINK